MNGNVDTVEKGFMKKYTLISILTIGIMICWMWYVMLYFLELMVIIIIIIIFFFRKFSSVGL